MNTRQKKILKLSRPVFWYFVQREWLSIFVGFGLGIVAAALIHLLRDQSFRQLLSSKFGLATKLVDTPREYFPYATTIAIVIFLGVLFRVPGFLQRYLRSWWAGVTGALVPLSFLSSFLALALNLSSLQYRVAIAASTLVLFFVSSFVLHSMAVVRAQKTLREDDLRVLSRVKPATSEQWSASDDPIRTWPEDVIGRAALVDSMSIKLLISKTPVLALFGELGSGKTSTLNLLREHLGDKAIVVFFSTWLPGSEETFTKYLLNDIANECQKHYFVPGLRKSVQRFARALGENVPYIRSYLELLPKTTQKDDIESVYAALARLPKRVVVLLDELDRMEREELITLLKVIRGISHLPNLSFVCAADFKSIVTTVKGDFKPDNITYFEKFFFDVINIPDLDPISIKKAGTERLVITLKQHGWFKETREEEGFRSKINAIWEKGIAPFCHTLRAIGLLANAVGTAAAPLAREVHPVDLTLIEVLRRFKPEIHSIVARNSVVLTGGAGMLRGGAYHSDKERERMGKNLLADIQKAVPLDEEVRAIKKILNEMFPRFRKIGDQSWPSMVFHNGQEPDEENSKRIRQPEIFPAYFRYELPEAIFPFAQMEQFLRRMEEGAKEGNTECIFQEMLDSMEKGALKRDDFLRKLAEVISKSVPIPVAKNLVHAAVRAADKYTYDMLAAFGEAGHILRLVLRVAERLPASERSGFLENCISEASDDTMAMNVLTKLTGPHEDFNLETSLAELHPAFIRRMRERYGEHVDAAVCDLSRSDPWAFNYWGHDPKSEEIKIDPEDRAIQRGFWLRYIGDSRSRLAHAFRAFFMPENVNYSEDPVPFVENKIPLSDLGRLYKELSNDDSLNDVDRRALRVLKRLLDGEFKNGAGLESYNEARGAVS